MSATLQGRCARPFARPFRRQWATRGGMNGPNCVGNAAAGRGKRHPATGGERDPTKLGARCADLGSSSPIGPPRDPSGARDHQRRDRPPPDSRSTAALPPGCPGQAAALQTRTRQPAPRGGGRSFRTRRAARGSAGPAAPPPYAHSYAHYGGIPWHSAGLAGGAAADEPHAQADRGRARQGAGAGTPSFGPGGRGFESCRGRQRFPSYHKANKKAPARRTASAGRLCWPRSPSARERERAERFSRAMTCARDRADVGSAPGGIRHGWASRPALCRLRAPFHPVIDPPRSGEKLGGPRLLGHPPHLAAKAKGDRSMVGKRERPEDAYGRGLRDPRDMVKGRLPEPQPPVMQGHVPCSTADAGPPGWRAETADPRTLRRVGGGQ